MESFRTTGGGGGGYDQADCFRDNVREGTHEKQGGSSRRPDVVRKINKRKDKALNNCFKSQSLLNIS